MRVAANRDSRPIVLTCRLFEKSISYGSPVWLMMYVPDMPMPRRMLSMGLPKHAEKPIIGAKAYTHVLAIREKQCR